MYLTELVDLYARNHETGISRGTRDQLSWSVGCWQRQAGRRLSTEDLQRDRVNEHLDWLKEHRAADTVRTRRGNLLALWTFAWEEGLVAEAPRKIRKLKAGRKIPTAWTPEEIDRLAAAARRIGGRFAKTQVPRGLYWESLILAGWDTALRLGDLERVEREWIDAAGTMVICQSKTGDDVLVAMRPATLDLIDRCCADPPRRRVWPAWGRRDVFYAQFRRLVQEAGVRKGTFKWIRRASITQVERQQRGAGTPHAGHRTRAVTERNYIDPRQLEPDRPQPPALESQSSYERDRANGPVAGGGQPAARAAGASL